MEGSLVGEIVKFGKYKIKDKNDYSDIEWIVLAKNEHNILLLSKYIIEAMPYHEIYEATTWEKCSLRRWLNGPFYETAFSGAEKDGICQVRNEKHGFGYLTIPVSENDLNDPGVQHRRDIPVYINSASILDKVFLLSSAEWEWYQNTIKQYSAEPTQYAKDKGLSVIRYHDHSPSGYTLPSGRDYCERWWLRDRGQEADLACFVYSDNRVSEFGFPVFFSGSVLHGVRPAILVNALSIDC